MLRKDLITSAVNTYKLSKKNLCAPLEKLQNTAEDFLQLAILELEKTSEIATDLLLKHIFDVLHEAIKVELNESEAGVAVAELSKLQDAGLKLLTPAPSAWYIPFVSSPGTNTEIQSDLRAAYLKLIQDTVKYVNQLKEKEAKSVSLSNFKREEYATAISPRAAEKLREELQEQKSELQRVSKQFEEFKQMMSASAPALILKMTEFIQLEAEFERCFGLVLALFSMPEGESSKGQLETVQNVHDMLSGIFFRIFAQQKSPSADAKLVLPDEKFFEIVNTQCTQQSAATLFGRSGGALSRLGRKIESAPVNGFSQVTNKFYQAAKKMLAHLMPDKISELRALIETVPPPLFEVYVNVFQVQKSMQKPMLSIENAQFRRVRG